MTTAKLHRDGSAFAWSGPVPGDKSLSHRALIFAALSSGEQPCLVRGLGPGADISSTRSALISLGARFDGERVSGRGLRPPQGPIDCGNSGTTLRLLAGVMAASGGTTTLAGDESLNRRPMRRLIGPLEALGAVVRVSPQGTPPVSVGGGGGLRGATVEVGLASAQVRSAFQLAAVQAEGSSQIDSPSGFRDHTERWLQHFGLGHYTSETAFVVEPGPVPVAEYDVPGDPSSAAYLWAAAALVRGASVRTIGVSINPGRTGFLDILRAFGADVNIEQTGDIHGDPVGDVTVTGGAQGGLKVSGPLAVRALDELPLVGVLAAAADGETRVADAGELRAKESDRIETTVAMIRALGGSAEATHDGFVVSGGRVGGGRVAARGDHRIAMAAAVAATVSTERVTVDGADAAAVSWPGFYDELERVWSSR